MSSFTSFLSNASTLVSTAANAASVALEKTGQFLETVDEGVGKLGIEGEDLGVDTDVPLTPKRASSPFKNELINLPTSPRSRAANVSPAGPSSSEMSKPLAHQRKHVAADGSADSSAPPTRSLPSLLQVPDDEVAASPLVSSPLSTGSDGSSFDFNAYGASLEHAIKERDDEIVKLKRMVDSLKNKHSLEEVRDTMQPQLQRLMYILQDTQDKIRAKDREISKLKAQLLPGHVEEETAPLSPERRRGGSSDERVAKLNEEIARLGEAKDSAEKAAAEGAHDLVKAQREAEASKLRLKAALREKAVLEANHAKAKEEILRTREAFTRRAEDKDLEMHRLRSELHAEKDRCAAATETAGQWEARATELEKEMEATLAKVQGLEEGDARGQVEVLEAERQRLQDQMEELRRQVEESEGRRRGAEEEVVELRREVEEGERRSAQEKQELGRMIREAEGMLEQAVRDAKEGERGQWEGRVRQAEEEGRRALKEAREEGEKESAEMQQRLKEALEQVEAVRREGGDSVQRRVAEVGREMEERVALAEAKAQDIKGCVEQEMGALKQRAQVAEAKAQELEVGREEEVDRRVGEVRREMEDRVRSAEARAEEVEGDVEGRVERRVAEEREALEERAKVAEAKAEELLGGFEEQVENRVRAERELLEERVRVAEAKAEELLSGFEEQVVKRVADEREALEERAKAAEARAEELLSGFEEQVEKRVGAERELLEERAKAAEAKAEELLSGFEEQVEKRVGANKEALEERAKVAEAKVQELLSGFEEQVEKRVGAEREVLEERVRLAEARAAEAERSVEGEVERRVQQARAEAEELRREGEEEARQWGEERDGLVKMVRAAEERAEEGRKGLEVEVQRRVAAQVEELQAKVRRAEEGVEEEVQRRVEEERERWEERLKEVEGRGREEREELLARLRDAEDRVEQAMKDAEEEVNRRMEMERGRWEERMRAAEARVAEGGEEMVSQLQRDLASAEERVRDAEEARRRAEEELQAAEAQARGEAERARGEREAVEERLCTATQEVLRLEDSLREAREEARREVGALQARLEEEVAGLRAQGERERGSSGEERDRALARLREVEQGHQAALQEMQGRFEGERRELKEALAGLKKALGEADVAHEAEIFRQAKDLDAIRERAARAAQAEEELERLRLKKKRDLEDLRRLNEHVAALQMRHAEEVASLRVEREGLMEELDRVQEERRAASEEAERARREGEEERRGWEQQKAELELQASRAAHEEPPPQPQQGSGEEERARAEALGQQVARVSQELQEAREREGALAARLREVEADMARKAATEAEVMADMSRRLQAAECAREQLWKENAKLREDSVSSAHSRVGAASIVQRSKATAAGGTQRAGGLFSSPSAADEEDVEAAQESGTAYGAGLNLEGMNVALRRARLVIQRLPVVEACINHTRRRFPAQTLLFEQKVLPHVTPKSIAASYLILLHLWVVFSCLGRSAPAVV